MIWGLVCIVAAALLIKKEVTETFSEDSTTVDNIWDKTAGIWYKPRERSDKGCREVPISYKTVGICDMKGKF